MKITHIGDGKVFLLAGGGKIYADIAARFARSERAVVEIVNSPYSPEIVGNLISSNHLAALEFDNFLFGVEGYSRVCEAQLIRKRHASYLVKSGRAELGGKREFNVVLPFSLDTNEYRKLLAEMEAAYNAVLSGACLRRICAI